MVASSKRAAVDGSTFGAQEGSGVGSGWPLLSPKGARGPRSDDWEKHVVGDIASPDFRVVVFEPKLWHAFGSVNHSRGRSPGPALFHDDGAVLGIMLDLVHEGPHE